MSQMYQSLATSWTGGFRFCRYFIEAWIAIRNRISVDENPSSAAFRPKGPYVPIARASGPGRCSHTIRKGPTGRPFVDSPGYQRREWPTRWAFCYLGGCYQGRWPWLLEFLAPWAGNHCENYRFMQYIQHPDKFEIRPLSTALIFRGHLNASQVRPLPVNFDRI